MNKEYQGIKVDFVAQKNTFSQVVPMPNMPKINVELRAKKDNTLINGMEVTACNSREQLMNLVSVKGVVNYTSNTPNKVVSGE